MDKKNGIRISREWNSLHAVSVDVGAEALAAPLTRIVMAGHRAPFCRYFFVVVAGAQMRHYAIAPLDGGLVSRLCGSCRLALVPASSPVVVFFAFDFLS